VFFVYHILGVAQLFQVISLAMATAPSSQGQSRGRVDEDLVQNEDIWKSQSQAHVPALEKAALTTLINPMNTF
jgi:hypothetical protein